MRVVVLKDGPKAGQEITLVGVTAPEILSVPDWAIPPPIDLGPPTPGEKVGRVAYWHGRSRAHGGPLGRVHLYERGHGHQDSPARPAEVVPSPRTRAARRRGGRSGARGNHAAGQDELARRLRYPRVGGRPAPMHPDAHSDGQAEPPRQPAQPLGQLVLAGRPCGAAETK